MIDIFKIKYTGGTMKYLDNGIIYVMIDNNLTHEEIQQIKESYNKERHTIVFLKGGTHNMRKTVSNLLKASL